MKIYFAGSIRGGREDVDLYANIIKSLQSYGEVLTEHVGSISLTTKGEFMKEEEFIYNRDIEWLEQSDIVVAEVTQPSIGVGYELAYAEKKNKRTICLFRKDAGKSLSAMIRGNNYFEIYDYTDLNAIKKILTKIF